MGSITRVGDAPVRHRIFGRRGTSALPWLRLGRAVLPRRPLIPSRTGARRKRISNPQLHILAWVERTLVTLFDYDRSLRLVTPLVRHRIFGRRGTSALP
jgi:hypothetical protein